MTTSRQVSERVFISLDSSYLCSILEAALKSEGLSSLFQNTYNNTPSSSILIRSPVWSHPSTNVSLVALSLSRYPSATQPDRMWSSPGSFTAASVPSSRTTLASTPGSRMPVEPGLFFARLLRTPGTGLLAMDMVWHVKKSNVNRHFLWDRTHAFRHAITYERSENIHNRQKDLKPTFPYSLDAFKTRKQCFRKRYRQVSSSTMNSLDAAEVSILKLRAVDELVDQWRDEIYSRSAVSEIMKIL